MSSLHISYDGLGCIMKREPDGTRILLLTAHYPDYRAEEITEIVRRVNDWEELSGLVRDMYDYIHVGLDRDENPPDWMQRALEIVGDE